MLAIKSLLQFLTKDMTLDSLRQVKAEVVSLPKVLKWIPPIKQPVPTKQSYFN